MLIRVLSGLYVYDFLEIVKPICSFSLLTSLGRLKYLISRFFRLSKIYTHSNFDIELNCLPNLTLISLVKKTEN